MKIVESNSYLVAELALPYDHTKFFKVYKSDHFGYIFRPMNLASCLGTYYPANNYFTENARRMVFPNTNANRNPLFDECSLNRLTELVSLYIDFSHEDNDKITIATEFNSWVKEKVLPFLLADESPVKVKEPTERELLEKLAEVVDVRAEDLLNAILHLREEKFRERQADLKEILS